LAPWPAPNVGKWCPPPSSSKVDRGADAIQEGTAAARATDRLAAADSHSGVWIQSKREAMVHPPTSDPSTVVLSIYADGVQLDDDVGVRSVLVTNRVRAGPSASILLDDGGVREAGFPLATSGALSLGTAVAVAAGYGEQVTLFDGSVSAEAVALTAANECTLRVDCAGTPEPALDVDAHWSPSTPDLVVSLGLDVLEFQAEIFSIDRFSTDAPIDSPVDLLPADIPLLRTATKAAPARQVLTGRVVLSGTAVPKPLQTIRLERAGGRYGGAAAVIGVRQQISLGTWTTTVGFARLV